MVFGFQNVDEDIDSLGILQSLLAHWKSEVVAAQSA
jgi:hypothetical protein